MNEISNNNIKNLLNQLSIEEDDEVIHEINHEIFESELYIILNGDNIMALTSEDDSDYLIPVFSDYASLRMALDELNDDSLEFDIATGEELMSLYLDDDNFLGLAINPPEYDFVLTDDDVEVVE